MSACAACGRPFPPAKRRCSCCGVSTVLDPCTRCRAEGYVAETLDLREVNHAAEAEGS